MANKKKKKAQKKITADEPFIAEEFEIVDIDSLTLYEHNVQCHTKMQVQKIASSIRNYGYDVPIVVDENMTIIKGHGRWQALKFLGRDKAPIIIRKGLTEAAKKALMISDNKLAEADWDIKALFDEILALDGDFDLQDLGFDRKSIDKLMPDDMLAELPGVLSKEERRREKERGREGNMTLESGERNPFYGESSFISALEDTSLYDLSLVDYVNSYDEIIVGYSSGKDSHSSAVWCMENIGPEKVRMIFGQPGTGVEWPQTVAYIEYANDYFQKKYGWKEEIIIAGGPSNDRLEELLLQRGYPIPHLCFVQANVKLLFLERKEAEMGWRDETKKRLRIIAIRWEESRAREREYPERGRLAGSPFDYCSPIISWSGEQTARYVYEHGAKLCPLYQFSPRAGCTLCPSATATDVWVLRNWYPNLYRQILDWHCLAARKKGMFSKFVDRFLIASDEVAPEALEAAAPFKQYSMTDQELIDHLSRIRGEEVPADYFN